MITRILRYEVRKEALAPAVEATRAFVDEVNRKEGGVASYKAYQGKEAPTHFLHVMTFRVPSAEQYHKGTAWHKKFRAAIEPIAASIADESYSEIA